MTWHIEDMNGRQVAIRPVLFTDTSDYHMDLYRCGDCGQQANKLVLELEHIRHNVWAWCGVCDIGG